MKATALAIACGRDEREVAALWDDGATSAEVKAWASVPENALQVDAERIRLEADGKTVEPRALQLLLKLIARMDAEANTVDAFGASDLIKPLIRILENHHRVRLAERSSTDCLPTLYFSIGADMQMTMEVVPAEKPAVIIEDVTPRAFAPAPAATEPPTEAQNILDTLALTVIPLEIVGGAGHEFK